MNMKDIENQVEMIRLAAGDDEIAHTLEDSLMVEFIEYVATLKLPIGIKARKVLETRRIDFARWCA